MRSGRVMLQLSSSSNRYRYPLQSDGCVAVCFNATDILAARAQGTRFRFGILLTDAIANLLEEEIVLAYRFQGKRYDCDSKFGYFQATVEYVLKHDEFRTYL